jgi:hypothetical protein
MANQSGTNEPAQETKPDGVEGEGSYSGTRDYNQHLERHRKEANIDELAEKARKAVEGPESRELERAEQQGKRGPAKTP